MEEHEIPLVPEMSEEEKQIMADLKKERDEVIADAETKAMIQKHLGCSESHHVKDLYAECRMKQVPKHLHEFIKAFLVSEASQRGSERVSVRVIVDAIS